MKRTLVGLGLVTCLAGVMPAFAAGPDADGKLYELTEARRIRQGRIVRRMATAALGGWVKLGTPLCPPELEGLVDERGCFVNIIASDDVDLSTGIGPVSGGFVVVVEPFDQNGLPTENPFDGPEAPVLRGTLGGTIDLSLGLAGVPLGYLINGTFEAHGTAGGPLAGDTSGHFNGVFRLPFQTSPSSCGRKVAVCYLDDDFHPFAAVWPDEFSLGLGTVRLDITFTDRGH